MIWNIRWNRLSGWLSDPDADVASDPWDACDPDWEEPYDPDYDYSLDEVKDDFIQSEPYRSDYEADFILGLI